MKAARRVRTRSKTSRRVRPISLTARVECLEKAFLFKSAPETAANLPRFTELADGGEHVATYDSETKLTWTAAPLPCGDVTWDQAAAKVKKLRLLGHSDWRLPTVKELISIIDYERFDPAVDPAFFKGPYGWTWSGTPAKSPSDCAWSVGLGGGFVYRFHQTYHLQVRAVRAGQPLGLGL